MSLPARTTQHCVDGCPQKSGHAGWRRWRVAVPRPTIGAAQPGGAAAEDVCPDSRSQFSRSSRRRSCSRRSRAGSRSSAPGPGRSGSASAWFSVRSRSCCSRWRPRAAARRVGLNRSAGREVVRTAACRSRRLALRRRPRRTSRPPWRPGRWRSRLQRRLRNPPSGRLLADDQRVRRLRRQLDGRERRKPRRSSPRSR